MREWKSEDLTHQQVDVTMTMGFLYKMTIFLHGDLAVNRTNGRYAVLLHQSDILTLQTEVLVGFKKLLGTIDKDH